MAMKHQMHTEALLLLALSLALSQPEDGEGNPDCSYIETGPFEDLILNATSDQVNPDKLKAMKKKSRVCLPTPCEDLEAYSGFFPVDDSFSSNMFFLHIKSKENSDQKPLLLWLQGGPGKSSLYGEFLENGPYAVDAEGKPYVREHTLLNQMNVLYVDQPIGAGYSFGQELPGTLNETSTHLMRLIRRFLRVFPEYKGRDFYVAGESYGARSAVGVAQKIITRQPWQLPLEFKGVMLGVGFLFDLVDTINSADYLFYSGLLDENSRYKFASQFEKIDSLVGQKDYRTAAFILSQTVLDMPVNGQKTLFQNLTGFEHHGSIARPETPKEPIAYFDYANSSDFKKRIHVNPSRALDGMWYNLAMKLAVLDFFVDIKTTVESVLNQIPTLFYTAEFDTVFPAVNLERHFRNLNWEGSELYRNACQRLWYGKQKPNELLGYVKRAYKVLYATVLFGGHYISLDRSEAVSELYAKFLKFSQDWRHDKGDDGTEADTPTCS